MSRKWSVLSYGYAPKNGQYSLPVPPHQSSTQTATDRTKETDDAMAGAKAITWGFARDEKANVAFIRTMMAAKDPQSKS